MGFSICSMVVDDVHFHLFLFSFSSWFDCDWLWLVWWYWMSENGWKLFVEGWKWTWQSFLFFLFCNDENKQGMKWNFNFIRFVFHFCSVWWLLAILAKRKQSSFFLDCDLRKRDFDQIGRNDRNLNRICKACFEFVLFSFFFLIWGLLKRRNVERGLKSACSQQLVKFEKERMKSVIFRICQTGWNSLAIGLAEWLKLVAIKQTTEIQQNKTNDDFDNDRTRFSSSSFSEWEKCSFL